MWQCLEVGFDARTGTVRAKVVEARDGRPIPLRAVRGGQAGKLSMREVLDLRERMEGIEEVAAHTGAGGGYNFGAPGTIFAHDS